MTTSSTKNAPRSDIAVIGAGIVGTNCALALVKEGFSVTMIDRDEPGEGCSFGNAGILSDASFVPIFGPDILRKVPGFLMDPLGPLTIRWTHLPHILPWLLRMLGKANKAHLKHASDAMHHLTIGCSGAYEKLAAEAGAPELIRQAPILHIYDNEPEFTKAEEDFKFRAGYGISYEALNRERLLELEPGLGPDFQWGHALLNCATATNPGRLVKVLAQSFIKQGGQFRKADVASITRKSNGGGSSFDIETDSRALSAERIVVAAGAYSHRIAKQFSDHIPLGTERGYHAVIAEPGMELNHAVGWKARAFFASPMEMGVRLAGTVELASLDAEPNYDRADVLAKNVKKMFPDMNTKITSRWMGRRPTLPDSMPVLGPSPKTEGVFYAFGHQHIGLICGPATGRVIAGLMTGNAPNFDIAPLSASRF